MSFATIKLEGVCSLLNVTPVGGPAASRRSASPVERPADRPQRLELRARVCAQRH
jgi:hypothetical protein